MLLNYGVGKDSWESLGLQGDQPIHPKENQFWILIGRTDTEAETPILWSPDVKNRLIWKDLDTGKDWCWEEKKETEDEIVGWHHHKCTWVWASSGSWWWTGKPGVVTESDMTEWRNSTEQGPWPNCGLSFCTFVTKWTDMTKHNLEYQWSLWGTFEIPKLSFLKTELGYDSTVNFQNWMK